MYPPLRNTVPCLLLLLTSSLHAQPFTEAVPISSSLTQVSYSFAAWGDYDSDGDLDILLTGYDEIYQYTNIYRNDTGTFTDIQAGLIPISGSAVAWGDYDNDGDLDIALAGNAGGIPTAKIYRHDAAGFADIGAGLMGVDSCSVAWGDYDNDGDLDLVLAGDAGTVWISKLYRNDEGQFQDIQANLPDVAYAGIAWGDADNDGDLDILITGHDGTAPRSNIYLNDAGLFTDSGADLIDVYNGAAAWGDYDNDGDLDIVLTGDDGTAQQSHIYRNDGGIFTDIQAGLPGMEFSSVAWGDADNDGDLDLLLEGWMGIGNGNITEVYRNDAGIFTAMGANLIPVSYGTVSWGDYDQDADLDILLTGDSAGFDFSKVYRNNAAVANTPPEPPSVMVGMAESETEIEWNWNAGSDAATPNPGLSYRLWIGTAMDSFNVVAPMADTGSGWRRIAAIGNLQGHSWTLQDAVHGQTYFGCVSAIDAGLSGSPCSDMTSVIAVDMRDAGIAQPFLITGSPNPTASKLHIHVPITQAVHYTLYTTAGQAVPGHSGKFLRELELDLTTLPSGGYILRLEATGFARAEGLRIIKL